jgi:DNA-3-methyladenine glycosylase
VRPLGPTFFARPSQIVARDLLGRLLVEDAAGDRSERLVGRIVEVEAYREDDPASHSFGGPRGRNLVMFGPPGRLYVYFTYGMHFCMNVVTGGEGEGSAVLLRALEPLRGLAAMARRRGTDEPRLLCSGPARLTQAYGIDRSWDGLPLTRAKGLWIGAGTPITDEAVAVGPRIGIRRAREEPWRFSIRNDPFVSRGRNGRASRTDAVAGVVRTTRRPR